MDCTNALYSTISPHFPLGGKIGQLSWSIILIVDCWQIFSSIAMDTFIFSLLVLSSKPGHTVPVVKVCKVLSFSNV